MGASDYTDGGGWAKLDGTAVDELSAIISTFSPKYIEKHTRMLLALYQSMSASGVITMGYRTLAERAGVTKRAAETFVKKLEDSGDLVIIGEKVNNGGRYVARRFSWMGGVTLEGDTPTRKQGGLRDTPTRKQGGLRDTSELLKSSQRAGGSATAAPTPNDSESFPPKPQEISNPLFKQRADLFLEGGE